MRFGRWFEMGDETREGRPGRFDDELLRAAVRDGAPDGVDRVGLVSWYQERAAEYDRAAEGEEPGGEAEEAALNARARARSVRRSRDW